MKNVVAGLIVIGPETWRTVHSQLQAPNALGTRRSNKLCVAIMTIPNAATIQVGKKTRSDKATIDQPSAQITAPSKPWKLMRKVHPKVTSVSSRKTSHSPRVSRKRDSSPFVLPRVQERNAPVPARKPNTGAQKCVIQRVRNNAKPVCVRSVGSNSN